MKKLRIERIVRLAKVMCNKENSRVWVDGEN